LRRDTPYLYLIILCLWKLDFINKCAVSWRKKPKICFVKSKCRVYTFCESTCNPLHSFQRFLLLIYIFSFFNPQHPSLTKPFSVSSAQNYILQSEIAAHDFDSVQLFSFRRPNQVLSLTIFTPRTTPLRYVALLESLFVTSSNSCVLLFFSVCWKIESLKVDIFFLLLWLYQIFILASTVLTDQNRKFSFNPQMFTFNYFLDFFVKGS